MSSYTWRVPSPPLDSSIEDLYCIEGTVPHQRLKVFPMPSSHLMVNLGLPFQVYKPDSAQPFTTCAESWTVGLWSTYHTVEWSREVRLYGVHFKPGGAYPFLKLPLSELHNEVVSLDAIWGSYAAQIRERLYEAPTVEAGLVLFERLLARLYEAPHSLRMVQGAITEIVQNRGVLSIRALSDQMGVSQSHLDTQFKRIVGIAPKELARFYRFVHVLRSIDPMQHVNWTRIAHQACFYDQSHFNKDFEAFTGHSPSDYLCLRRRLCALNPEQASNIGQLPVE